MDFIANLGATVTIDMPKRMVRMNFPIMNKEEEI
jgi:hypothetical protein